MDILLKPVITEKSMQQAANGWYTFKVTLQSEKPMIARAIEKQFKVNVTDIKTITMKAKPKRTGKRRIEVTRASWKKAIVKLKKDQKIDLFTFTEGTQK